MLVCIGMAFFLTTSVAISGIAVRRLHDGGKTGYWLMLYYAMPSWLVKSAGVDGIGLVFLAATLAAVMWAVIDLGVLRGDDGTNAFGPSPLNPANGFDAVLPAEI